MLTWLHWARIKNFTQILVTKPARLNIYRQECQMSIKHAIWDRIVYDKPCWQMLFFHQLLTKNFVPTCICTIMGRIGFICWINHIADNLWLLWPPKRGSAEKATATHSRTLAWRIPWTEEPGGLRSMGSRRVGHDWATSLSLFTFMHWRRKWQPTPPQQGLVGCRLWGRTESDTTDLT